MTRKIGGGPLASAIVLASALAQSLGVRTVELPELPEDPRVAKAREGLITHQYPSRHEKRRYFAKLRHKHPGLRLNRRLAPATGPGSINVESEMQQMIRAGNDKGAYELYQAHHQVQCLGHGNPCSKLKPWTHTWAAQYKRAA